MPNPAPLPPRRTRGDGNCFFRSFFFGYLEHLLLSGDGEERDRAVRQLEGLKKALVDVGGYDEIGEGQAGHCGMQRWRWQSGSAGVPRDAYA